MLSRVLFLLVAILSLLQSSLSVAQSGGSKSRHPSNGTDALAACHDLEQTLSNASEVFWPNSAQYESDITRPASFFNRANATCAIEPGTNEDVALIMSSLRNHSEAQFGIMGGGHNLNTGFSSTTGVLVSMGRFLDIDITSLSETGPDGETAIVSLGAGLQWQDVYTRVVSQGVNVLGGRFATVGVSGILLGGGYSWLSNRHAMAMDNIVEYTLINPADSKILTVTNETEPDLFFALKGGLNNFGIVTNFKVKGFPQTNRVWGGTIYTQPNNSDASAAAISNFSENNTDPDAQVIASFTYGNNTSFEVLILFYNNENNGEPPEVFKEFLSIPRQSQSDFFLRTFDNMTTSSLSTVGFLDGFRTQYSTISLAGHPLPVVQAFQRERDVEGPKMNALDPNFFGSWTIEPFLKSYYDQAVDSAFPHSTANVTFPENLELSWTDPAADEAMFASIRRSTKNLVQAGVDAGQDVGFQIEYPNYALPDTPVEHIYAWNLPRLKEIRARVDPDDIMLRAGGYKIV